MSKVWSDDAITWTEFDRWFIFAPEQDTELGQKVLEHVLAVVREVEEVLEVRTQPRHRQPRLRVPGLGLGEGQQGAEQPRAAGLRQLLHLLRHGGQRQHHLADVRVVAVLDGNKIDR